MMIERLRKFKKCASGNGGFSLAELMVAFGVLMMLVLTTALLITAATNTFTTTNKLMTLQYRSQTVMAQIQQYFMAADGGVTKDTYSVQEVEKDSDGNNQTVSYPQLRYYVVNKTGGSDGKGVVYTFVFYEHKKTLYLVSADAAAVKSALKTAQDNHEDFDTDAFIDASGMQPLCTGVTAFDINTDSVTGKNNFSRRATSVTVSIELEEQDKHYSARQIFTFRNKPSFIIGPDTGSGDTTKIQTLLKDVLPE